MRTALLTLCGVLAATSTPAAAGDPQAYLCIPPIFYLTEAIVSSDTFIPGPKTIEELGISFVTEKTTYTPPVPEPSARALWPAGLLSTAAFTLATRRKKPRTTSVVRG